MSVMQSDGTQIGASRDGDNLVVVITGATNSIAEHGEQLAWLTAALSPPDADRIVNSTPSLELIYSSSPMPGETLLHWEIKLHNYSQDMPLLPGVQLQELVRPVVVRGFPNTSPPGAMPRGGSYTWYPLSVGGDVVSYS
jgi:hypothetical protein